MEKPYIDKEKALKELSEKLENEELVTVLDKIGFTKNSFINGVSVLISLANSWYKKGYQDGQAAAHQNGGDVD